MNRQELEFRKEELKLQLLNNWRQQDFVEKYSDEWLRLEQICLQLVSMVDKIDEQLGIPFDPDWNARLYNGR